MSVCTVRWRSSGGRGEYEAIQSSALVDREIYLCIPSLGVEIPTEVRVRVVDGQGKPRLRKDSSNDRKKLHLVPLVMAVARLPEPAREAKNLGYPWPLDDKNFIISQMEFEISGVDDEKVVLEPIRAHILGSEKVVDLATRFSNIALDHNEAENIRSTYPLLYDALKAHDSLIKGGKNTDVIRTASSEVISLQREIFGITNLAAISTISHLPPSSIDENFTAKEGKFLVRMHAYRERNKTLSRKAKERFKQVHGNLYCECCGHDPIQVYGVRGDSRMHAHHRTPVEELLPDSVIRIEDLAMVCPNCHDIIHAQRPWLTVESLREHLKAQFLTVAA